jgi:hypothetical protein
MCESINIKMSKNLDLKISVHQPNALDEDGMGEQQDQVIPRQERGTAPLPNCWGPRGAPTEPAGVRPIISYDAYLVVVGGGGSK